MKEKTKKLAARFELDPSVHPEIEVVEKWLLELMKKLEPLTEMVQVTITSGELSLDSLRLFVAAVQGGKRPDYVGVMHPVEKNTLELIKFLVFKGQAYGINIKLSLYAGGADGDGYDALNKAAQIIGLHKSDVYFGTPVDQVFESSRA